ncbi:MAG: lipid-A-disaccharide synthase [Cytophagales bacterium]|nr:lipid-A-disaccharide synthase [Bernardetiaceae bacterium]MDW8209683.1 lipid-A-disaccharide synthase [Cytophagales bacterium]
MKYYLIAGEKSGDLHGGNLIRALKKRDPHGIFRAWGGDAMQQAGATLVKHIKETAIMGIGEVIANLKKILQLINFCKQDIKQFQPDVVILIDYAGFNLRIAAFAKKMGCKVFYYISPKVWVWNKRRIRQIKAYVDRMLVIMPFEKEFYAREGYPSVDYVGNPVFDAVKNFQPDTNFIALIQRDSRPLIALLPGSRLQEVKNILPVMVKSAQFFPNYQFAVAGVAHLPSSLYAPAIQEGIPVYFEKTYDLLSCAQAALVASGTATLETALFGVPQVVLYRTGWISALFFWLFIRLPFVSLVNLSAGREIVKELLQSDCTAWQVKEELHKLLTHKRKYTLQAYNELIKKIAMPFSASETAAALILQYAISFTPVSTK